MSKKADEAPDAPEAEVVVDGPRVVSPEEACAKLGVAPVTLAALVERGDLVADLSDDGEIVGIHL